MPARENIDSDDISMQVHTYVQVTGQYAVCGSAFAQATLLEGVARTAVSSTMRCFSAVAELAMEPPHQVIATTPEVRR
jgi:hypothetical protein